MFPHDELKDMLEQIAELALDNIDKWGFHLPICLGHSLTGERIYIVAEPQGDAEVDVPACTKSVLHQTRLWIEQRKLRAVALATVIDITVATDAGGTLQTAAVKIVLDHADEPGYVAFLTFQETDEKALPGTIIYQDLPERFFSPRDSWRPITDRFPSAESNPEDVTKPGTAAMNSYDISKLVELCHVSDDAYHTLLEADDDIVPLLMRHYATIANGDHRACLVEVIWQQRLSTTIPFLAAALHDVRQSRGSLCLQ